jgi:hypothetical protein
LTPSRASEQRPQYRHLQTLAIEVDSLFKTIRFYGRSSEDFIEKITRDEKLILEQIEGILDQMQQKLFRCKSYLRELEQ